MTIRSRLQASRASRASIALGFLALLVPSVPAGASTGSTGQADPGPSLSLVAQTTWVEPRGEFRVDLVVRGAPPGARLVPRLYRPVESREDFNQSLFGEVGDLFEAAGLAPVELDAIATAADGSQSASVAVAVRAGAPVEPLRINVPDPGVYPFEVTLVDEEGEAAAAPLVTHLVRLPGTTTSIRPLVTSLLLPLDAPPALRPDGSIDLTEQEVDRLTIIVNALTDHEVPLTVVPTPETVDALGSIGAEGIELVDRLAEAVELRRQVLASPYVDLPLSAWVDAGMSAELNQQRLRGAATLESRLARPDGRTWIADADLQPAAASRLRELGVDQLVLPAAAVEPLDEDQFPGTFTRPFDVASGVAPLSSVVVDGGLQGAFTRKNPALGAHQFLAELALIALERPGAVRGVVAQPPADWVPDESFLDVVLGGLAAAPTLVRPAVVDDLFDGVPPAREDGQFADTGPRLLRSLDPAPSPDLGAYPAELDQVRLLLGSYRSMTGAESRRFEDYEDRLLVSGSQRLTDGERRAYLDGARTGLRSQLDKIDAPDRQTATLTAQEGNIPLTIRSDLDYPVSVVLELSAGPRLDFPDGTRIPVLLDGESRRVNIPVRALTSGDTPLTVTVRSPDLDGVELATTRYTVRSTAVSGIGVVLTIGAALFLVLWWFRHWYRGRVRARSVDRVDPAARQV